MLFLIFSCEESPSEKCDGMHFCADPHYLRDGTVLVVRADRQARANFIAHRALKFYGIPEDYRKIMSIPLGFASKMDARCSIVEETASGGIEVRGIFDIKKGGEEP